MRRGRRGALAVLASAVVVAGAGLVLVPGPALAQTSYGSPTDPNVRFVGRWDLSNPSAAVPGWSGAYVTLGFTGTTVKLRQRSAIDLWASIDGAPFVAYPSASGTVNLTPSPLASGTHRLQVTYRAIAGSYKGDAVFQGVVLDSGARTVAPPMRSKLVEFVGDSLTVAQYTSKISVTGYAWLVGDRVGAEHTQIAQGGACLVSTSSGCVGMADGFLRTSATGGTWDFSRYAADAVVINLGTNDVGGNRVPTDQWIATYVRLLKDARSRYPSAALIALEPFRERFGDEAKAAVDQVRAGGDSRVQYVDTSGWMDSAADTGDGVHPTDAGHAKIATRLAPIVAAALASTPTPSTSSPTPTTSTPSPTPTAVPVVRDTFESGGAGAWTAKAAQKLTLSVVDRGDGAGRALRIEHAKKVKAGPKRVVDTSGLVAGQWYQVSASVRVGDGQRPAVLSVAPQQKLAGLVAAPARSAGGWVSAGAAFAWPGKGKLTLALTASTLCDTDALPTSVLLDDVTITAVSGPPPTPAAPSCTSTSGSFPLGGPSLMKGTGSGRCVSVPSTAAGTIAVLADCSSGAPGQTWTWFPSSGQLRPASGNACLQPLGAAVAGVRVGVGDCSGGTATLWGGSGTAIVHSASGLCLDAVAKGTAAGTELELWACNGGTNQQWSGA
ncbi:MAG: ricin-type beta-trefoil lectin domain protein [Kineosporiaceae bacterium]